MSLCSSLRLLRFFIFIRLYVYQPVPLSAITSLQQFISLALLHQPEYVRYTSRPFVGSLATISVSPYVRPRSEPTVHLLQHLSTSLFSATLHVHLILGISFEFRIRLVGAIRLARTWQKVPAACVKRPTNLAPVRYRVHVPSSAKISRRSKTFAPGNLDLVVTPSRWLLHAQTGAFCC